MRVAVSPAQSRVLVNLITRPLECFVRAAAAVSSRCGGVLCKDARVCVGASCPGERERCASILPPMLRQKLPAGQSPLRMLCASACLLERVSRRGAALGSAAAGAAAPDLGVNAWCMTEDEKK